MKLNGKTVECPSIEDMKIKYKGLFDTLEKLLTPDLIKNVNCIIVQLEWCNLYCELIGKTYPNKSDIKSQRKEYERFFERVFEDLLNLKPYTTGDLKLNIPLKHSDMHTSLKDILQDDKKAYNTILEFYPYTRKRSNKRELNNQMVERTSNMLKNPKKSFDRAKWRYIEAVKNKEFTFYNLHKGRAIECKDENKNSYFHFESISITSIDKKINFIENIDFEVSVDLITLTSLLIEKYKDIKVTITTKRRRFKQI